MNFDTLNKIEHGNIFFETGSHKGDGINFALVESFKRIISIEIEQKFIDICENRFKNEIESGVIQIIKGDSLKVMGDIINKIDEPITFWLDAHWDCDGIHGDKLCPLYEELITIKNHHIKNHIILIDDMRCLGGGNWGDGIYYDKIIEILKEINKDYKFSFVDGVVKNDILVANF